MTRDELLDEYLKHLNEMKGFVNIGAWFESVHHLDNHDNYQLMESIADELIERGWVTTQTNYKWSMMIPPLAQASACAPQLATFA